MFTLGIGIIIRGDLKYTEFISKAAAIGLEQTDKFIITSFFFCISSKETLGICIIISEDLEDIEFNSSVLIIGL